MEVGFEGAWCRGCVVAVTFGVVLLASMPVLAVVGFGSGSGLGCSGDCLFLSQKALGKVM